MEIIRLNFLYNTLYNNIKNNTCNTFIVECYSDTAALCAFKGINYTIESIVKQFSYIDLQEIIEDDNYKQFRINYRYRYMNIIVKLENNSIIFIVN